jgi:hypothetical protein
LAGKLQQKDSETAKSSRRAAAIGSGDDAEISRACADIKLSMGQSS